jgi:acyl carrier protein
VASQDHKKLEDLVTTILLDYAQAVPPGPRPLDPSLSIRGSLAVDSLSLVSAMVRLGEECGVFDLEEWGAEVANLKTVGDMIAFGVALQRSQEKKSLTGT